MYVQILVEGRLDAAVAASLIEHVGGVPSEVYGQRGWDYVRRKIQGFSNSAGRTCPLLALVDFMDTRLACPPAVIESWLPNPNRYAVLRVVEKEIESWILADRDGFSSFTGVPHKRLPRQPETLDDPKNRLISLVRRYGRKRIAQRVVPDPSSGAVEGPEYSDCLSEFVADTWSVSNAAMSAQSLERAVSALEDLATRCRTE